MIARLLVVVLALLSLGALSIYQDGKLIANCSAPAGTTTPPPPPADASQVLVFSHQTNGDGTPLNSKPLYDQIVIQPGQIYIEALVGQVHHVSFFSGTTLLRRENSYPYTFTGTLQAGTSLHLVAKVYSSESTVAATYQVLVYVADGGVDATTPEALKTVHMSWTAPVTREGGEPLSQSELAAYYMDLTGSSGTRTLIFGGESTTASISLPVGRYTASISVEDTEGRRSLPSLPVEFTL